jgi:rod shape-determining protein MreD
MKEFIAYFFLYVFFCTLQFFFGEYLNICRVFPNFILILVVYLGLTRGFVSAEITGFLFGLVWDVFTTDIFGLRTVIFTTIGYLTGMMSKHFDKDNLLAKTVIVLLANLVYWFGSILIYCVFSINEGSFLSFITTQTVFKILITILIAPVIFFILDSFMTFRS